MAAYPVRALRIRDADDTGEQARVLVDRVWPRGVSKQRADLYEWLRDIAPSTELRKWYNHDPAKFDEFRKLYTTEIDESEVATEALGKLRELAEQRPVALLTGTRDLEHSQAAVLAERLNGTS